MSSTWTRIQGVIATNTLTESTTQSRYFMQTVLDHLPHIQGCNGPMPIYLTIPNGHNLSSNMDETAHRSNLHLNENPWQRLFHAQTQCLLTIDHNFQDLSFESALRQITNLLTRLAGRVLVEDVLLQVSSHNRAFLFNSPDWLRQIRPSPWWTNYIQSLHWPYTNSLPS